MKTVLDWLGGMARKRIVGMVAAIALVLAATTSVLAWEQTLTSSPYTGLFTLTYRTSDIAAIASYVKWNSDGVNALRSDTFPRFDMTSDCVGGNPQGDKLQGDYVYTNVPNYSWSAMDDCGDWWRNEEVELYINAGSVNANQDYYFQVIWTKLVGSASGEINVSYQRNGDPSHDWLDKQNYSY